MIQLEHLRELETSVIKHAELQLRARAPKLADQSSWFEEQITDCIEEMEPVKSDTLTVVRGDNYVHVDWRHKRLGNGLVQVTMDKQLDEEIDPSLSRPLVTARKVYPTFFSGDDDDVDLRYSNAQNARNSFKPHEVLISALRIQRIQARNH